MDEARGEDAGQAGDRARVERALSGPAAQRLAAALGEGWRVAGTVTNTGFPSLDVEGPAFDDGRGLYVQVEAPRGGDGTQFSATIGTLLDAGDLEVDGLSAPAWVERARLIGGFLEDHWAGRPYAVSDRPAPRTQGGEEAAKAVIAQRHGLPLRWAKGYADSYIGVRTERFGAEHLETFLGELAEVLPDLHHCLQPGE